MKPAVGLPELTVVVTAAPVVAVQIAPTVAEVAVVTLTGAQPAS